MPIDVDKLPPVVDGSNPPPPKHVEKKGIVAKWEDFKAIITSRDPNTPAEEIPEEVIKIIKVDN